MLDELLKLHEIKYVISVDDCYLNPGEVEIKSILFDAMNNSFEEFRETIEKMGKKEQLADIEQLIELSDEKVALIASFLDELSSGQLTELYGLISQKGNEKYSSEKENLIGFLETLKERGCVEKYSTCASTKEALDIDYMDIGKESNGILWLIDRDFQRVGESAEAGLELAKTIVGRQAGPKNYIYILSSLERDTGKEEEEIEKEFDLMLCAGREQKETSFIYYLYKQRIATDKPEKITKGLAQGFKRKACYELFDLYTNSLQEGVRVASDEVRKIRQNTLNYLLDEMVRENGESYLEFLTRLVGILYFDSYQNALANNNKEIVRKIYYYKQLCKIMDDKVSDKKKATEKVKIYREKELYNKHINRQHLELTTGDIFRVGDSYYFLASQPCDTCLRSNGERVLEDANLLLICDGSKNPSFEYKLSCFDTYLRPVVKYQVQMTFPFEILDLCVQNENGKAEISLDAVKPNGDLSLKYYAERYTLRMKNVVSILGKIIENESVLENMFSNISEIDICKAKKAYEENKMAKSELLKYKIKGEMLCYDVQRICRLNELISIDIVNKFGINVSRIGHSFDFTERTRRNT